MRFQSMLSALLPFAVACSGGSTIGTGGGPGLGARCDSVADCGGVTPMCVSGACVECASAADCGGDPCARGLCDTCSGDGDCAGTGNPFCIDGECEECRSTDDCSAGEVCHPRHECDPVCTDSTMCTSGDRPTCVADPGICVQCQRDEDCPAGEPFCTDTGRCRECRSFRDCGTGSPFCVEGECVECVANTHCPAGSLCSDNLDCSEGPCTSDATCGGDHCNLETGMCVECVVDEHCNFDPQIPVCVGFECVECREAADCPATEPICEGNQCRN